MLVKSMVVLLALGGAVVVEAAGIPASSCTYRSLNHLTGFDCNLYPSTAGAFNGNVSFTFASLLPGFDPTFEALTTGFIVMDNTPAAVLADGSQADLDRSHWTQILQFKDSGGLSNQGLAAESITLFTGGGYPATATVTDVNSFALYFAEPTSGSYVFVADANHTYTLNQVPEPATFGMLAGAMAMLAGLRRRQKASV